MPRRSSYSHPIRPHPYNSRENMNDRHRAPAVPSGTGSSSFIFSALPIPGIPSLPITTISSLLRTSMSSFPTLASMSNPCPYCPRLFMTPRALAEHLPSHCGGSMDSRRLFPGMLESANLTVVRQRLAYLGKDMSLSSSLHAKTTLGISGSGVVQGSNGQYHVRLGVLEPRVNTMEPPVEYDFLGLCSWVRVNETDDSDEYSLEGTRSVPEIRALLAAVEAGDEGESSSLTMRSRRGLDLSLKL